ncbi:MAG: hypothetical protein ACRC5M_06845 [Anaeroplasmataceae bacterium]
MSKDRFYDKYFAERDKLIANAKNYKSIKKYEKDIIKLVRKYITNNKILERFTNKMVMDLFDKERERYMESIRSIFTLRSQYESNIEMEKICEENGIPDSVIEIINRSNTRIVGVFDLLTAKYMLVLYRKNNKLKIYTKVYIINKDEEYNMRIIESSYILRI